MADYQEMRAELRAFYPKYGQFAGPVKDSRQIESVKKIRAELEAWYAAHPDYDALDVRRESYCLFGVLATEVNFDSGGGLEYRSCGIRILLDSSV